jgi:hypothetical protein
VHIAAWLRCQPGCAWSYNATCGSCTSLSCTTHSSQTCIARGSNSRGFSHNSTTHTNHPPLPHPLQERAWLLEHIAKRPEAQWKACALFSFRNEAKVYGSPMFDAVYREVKEGVSRGVPLGQLVTQLKTRPLPWAQQKA